MSTSHLTVVFNVAEKVPNASVYDIRWPIAHSVAEFPTRKSFRKILFDEGMVYADEIKKMINTGIQENSATLSNMASLLSKAMHVIALPCSFNDTSLIIQEEKSNKTRRLALMDQFGVMCSVAVARRLKADYVFVSALMEPLTYAYLTGAPLPMASTMANMLSKLPSEMNLLDRVANVFGHKFFDLFISSLPIARFFYYNSSEPDIYASQENTLLFANNHKYIELPQPRTLALIDMGNYEPAKKEDLKIDQDLKKFIEDPKFDGVIIFSMSTYTNDGEFDLDLIGKFSTAFKKFPKIGFLWRINDLPEEFHGSNIKVAKWIPQKALFEHHRTLGVISHCGQNSFLEAINAGVPIIGIPTMGDQFYNAKKITYFNLGVVLQAQNLTDVSIHEVLNTILTDANIRRRSKNFGDILKTERELGMNSDSNWWIEWRFRHDQKTMDKYVFPKGSRMGFMEYFNLDILFVAFLIPIVIGYVIKRVFF